MTDDGSGEETEARRPRSRAPTRLVALAGVGVALVFIAYATQGIRQRMSMVSGAAESSPRLEPATPSVAAGAALWRQYCAACHVAPAGAATALGPVLLTRDYLRSVTDQHLDSIITRGIPRTTMTAWGSRFGPLSPMQVQSVVAFMRSQPLTEPGVPLQEGEQPITAR